MGPVRQALRDATREIHDRLDRAPRLRPLTEPTLTRDQYRTALVALHGFHTPVEARLGEIELWEIVNVDTQDHVFHLHTWPFQVWRRDGAAPACHGWRDTINLRPGERVELLVPFWDYAGTSLFHCHIAEHGDAGMMGLIEVAA